MIKCNAGNGRNSKRKQRITHTRNMSRTVDQRKLNLLESTNIAASIAKSNEIDISRMATENSLRRTEIENTVNGSCVNSFYFLFVAYFAYDSGRTHTRGTEECPIGCWHKPHTHTSTIQHKICRANVQNAKKATCALLFVWEMFINRILPVVVRMYSNMQK